jgi:hypothetical protein
VLGSEECGDLIASPERLKSSGTKKPPPSSACPQVMIDLSTGSSDLPRSVSA